MHPVQQQDIQRIVTAYRESDDTQRPRWREIAAYIYANALRDEDISPIELHTAFKPLERIASSAGFMENAEAVGRAMAQPVEEAVTAARTGRAWTATALHLLRMQHEPFYPWQQLEKGFKATATSIEQWAEHATGAWSMEARERLARVYELPHAQRLQALHGITLHDTATMVGIGTLPGLLPKSGVAAEAAMAETIEHMAQDATWPIPFPPPQKAELAWAGPPMNAGKQGITHLMMMASPPPGHDDPASPSTPKNFGNAKQKNGDGSVPEEIMRYREIVMLDETHEAFSRHLASIRVLDGKRKIEVYAHENKLIDQYTNYLINPRIVQTEDEYQQLMQSTRHLVSQVGQSELHRALAEEADPSEALLRSQEPIRLFEKMVPWLEARRQRQLTDMLTEDAEYDHMQAALQQPDAVGYGRSVSPRSTTERELHHADYWERLWQDVGELADHLQTLGLQAQADHLLEDVRAMVHIRLDDSKASHATRMAQFMAIAEDAQKVDIHTLSGQGYTSRGFEKIRDNISGELHHLRDEIGQEQEYFIRSQLWRWRHTQENRAQDATRYAAVREQLFGDPTAQQAPDPER